MPPDLSFGQWIKQHRKSLDLKQEDLAGKVGCSVSLLQKIEADERRPSRQLTELLLIHLEIDTAERAALLAFARRTASSEQSALLTSSHHDNLPAELTPLLGREREVASVQEYLWRDTVRLLSLLGPGGVGKTRLAIHAAANLLDDFADGVVCVPLAPIHSTSLVASAIAQALSLKGVQHQDVMEEVKTYLRERKLLLILDNFEHVMGAASVISELLVAAHKVKVLVTSRRALHLSNEHMFVVPPLGFALPARLPCLDELAQLPAVALFVARMQAVRPAFVLTQANVTAVTRICALLDGLPLAIELAAAWGVLLEPHAMLARLEGASGRTRLDVLVDGPCDLPVRQQTLRNTITWSYALLGEAEQLLFARLAVFVGGCTVEVAVSVCSGVVGHHVDVEKSLLALLHSSMLWSQVETDGVTRCMMLETIREYALEHLIEWGEADILRQQHATYYLKQAEAAEQEFHGPRQHAWLDWLAADLGNIRAALEWTLKQSHGEMALRLCGALWRFWYVRGYLSEGREWLAQALAQRAMTPLDVQAKALNGAGYLSYVQGDAPGARALLWESLALRRELGDKRGIAEVLNTLGNVAGLAQGNTKQARLWYEESLLLSRELGHRYGVANTLNNLGLMTLYEGDYPHARALLQESQALFEAHDYERGVVIARTNLARVALEMGDGEKASATLRENLVLFWQLGEKPTVAECLEGLAAGVLQQGRVAHAAWYCGAAEALREAINSPLPILDQPFYARTAAAVQAHMGEASVQAAWHSGQIMRLEQVVEYALHRERRHICDFMPCTPQA
ncbi:MAG: tetratricopeptide repeat protein [Herpetosiphonaceae bacterium]|nr:tetratricopeptide repeat protein [Herpetosiphonaceae bacterium]